MQRATLKAICVLVLSQTVYMLLARSLLLAVCGKAHSGADTTTVVHIALLLAASLAALLKLTLVRTFPSIAATVGATPTSLVWKSVALTLFLSASLFASRPLSSTSAVATSIAALFVFVHQSMTSAPKEQEKNRRSDFLIVLMSVASSLTLLYSSCDPSISLQSVKDLSTPLHAFVLAAFLVTFSLWTSSGPHDEQEPPLPMSSYLFSAFAVESVLLLAMLVVSVFSSPVALIVLSAHLPLLLLVSVFQCVSFLAILWCISTTDALSTSLALAAALSFSLSILPLLSRQEPHLLLQSLAGAISLLSTALYAISTRPRSTARSTPTLPPVFSSKPLAAIFCLSLLLSSLIFFSHPTVPPVLSLRLKKHQRGQLLAHSQARHAALCVIESDQRLQESDAKRTAESLERNLLEAFAVSVDTKTFPISSDTLTVPASVEGDCASRTSFPSFLRHSVGWTQCFDLVKEADAISGSQSGFTHVVLTGDNVLFPEPLSPSLLSQLNSTVLFASPGQSGLLAFAIVPRSEFMRFSSALGASMSCASLPDDAGVSQLLEEALKQAAVPSRRVHVPALPLLTGESDKEQPDTAQQCRNLPTTVMQKNCKAFF